MEPDDLTTEQTRSAEGEEARAEHRADRPPTPEEERLADANPPDPTVAEHAREMYERGAAVRGEGQIES